MQSGPLLVLIPIYELPTGLISWLADQLIELLVFDVYNGEMTSTPEKSYAPDHQQHNGGITLSHSDFSGAKHAGFETLGCW